MARLVLTDGTIFDSATAALRPVQAVVMADQRIVDVVDGNFEAGPDDNVIDCTGKTILPGLIDAHVHVAVTTMDFGALAGHPESLRAISSARILEAMLSRGFTTVRDAGGADIGLSTAIERGLVNGPTLLRAGRALSQTGGHGDVRTPNVAGLTCACEIADSGIALLADGADAVRRAAREQLRQGAHAIKVMASGGVASPTDPLWMEAYTIDELRAAVEEAERRHTYVLAHAYTPGAIIRAVEAGVRSIEHGNLLDAEAAEVMAAAGAALVPTLVTYWAIAEYGEAFGLPRWAVAKVGEVLDAGKESVRIALDAGVTVGFGTDLLGEAHDFQNREFALRAEVQSPADVIAAATRDNAAILGLEGEAGVVAPGARADVVVVAGDPTDDISLLADPADLLVIRNGVPNR
jgi:imidazolonepropionase-like amidohydrolase